MSSLGRAAALLMLLLIGLASCSTKPQPLNSDASAKAYIPLNISGWSYTHESMQSVQLHRTWDTHILDAAATGVNPEHLRQLVDKLDSGKPITVVAFGDSITSDFGGCFHSNEQMLRSVVPSLSHVYVNNKCGAFLPPMADVKWLAVFMDFVNHTWPHPNHTLVNLALPGAADMPARVCACMLILPACMPACMLQLQCNLTAAGICTRHAGSLQQLLPAAQHRMGPAKQAGGHPAGINAAAGMLSCMPPVHSCLPHLSAALPPATCTTRSTLIAAASLAGQQLRCSSQPIVHAALSCLAPAICPCAGAAADFFARGLCLERWLPRQADLVLVQHLPVLLSSNVGLGMEKLLWRVMQHLGQDAIDSRQRPAFLLLNMFRWVLGVPHCLGVLVLQADMAAAAAGSAAGLCWRQQCCVPAQLHHACTGSPRDRFDRPTGAVPCMRC